MIKTQMVFGNDATSLVSDQLLLGFAYWAPFTLAFFQDCTENLVNAVSSSTANSKIG